jgi:hypothetical protein
MFVNHVDEKGEIDLFKLGKILGRKDKANKKLILNPDDFGITVIKKDNQREQIHINMNRLSLSIERIKLAFKTKR